MTPTPQRADQDPAAVTLAENQMAKEQTGSRVILQFMDFFGIFPKDFLMKNREIQSLAFDEESQKELEKAVGEATDAKMEYHDMKEEYDALGFTEKMTAKQEKDLKDAHGLFRDARKKAMRTIFHLLNEAHKEDRELFSELIRKTTTHYPPAPHPSEPRPIEYVPMRPPAYPPPPAKKKGKPRRSHYE